MLQKVDEDQRLGRLAKQVHDILLQKGSGACRIGCEGHLVLVVLPAGGVQTLGDGLS